MKKLGIGKKDKGSDPGSEDSKRSHLFGGRSSKSKSPAQAANPYAVPQGNPGQDPYAARPPQPPPGMAGSTYSGMGSPQYPDSGRASVATQPPAYDKGGYNAPPDRNGKSPVPRGGYGGGPQGPPDSRYNNQGYGSDPYGSSKPAPDRNPRQGGGGYGGMSGPPSGADSDRRNELFGGAKQRLDDRQQRQDLPPGEQQSGGVYGGPSGMPDQLDNSYAPYTERQLTAEEQEEEDVQATKDEIQRMKREDVSSTRNALRIAEQAEQSGRATLERLAAQGERIHNTEKNLDLAASQNRIAEEKARELKHLNRSMFAPSMQNPFTKQRRVAEREQAILDTHRKERERRDATRAAAWESSSRQQEYQRDLRGASNATAKKGSVLERSKYQFEADSDDERMEDEIDSNLDAISGAVSRMNMLGKAMGTEVDAQNKHLTGIINKADQVDDQIAANRARLDRF